MLSRTASVEQLGTPENLRGNLNLAVSVCVSSMIVKYMQDKKYIPADPFKG